ncbi:MAG: tRNA (adenosine(37)-N6)-threonylcarbamoyltransferase complex ATPase subunit type 1 TsaE [Candidatus Caldatribacteriota bacterium]
MEFSIITNNPEETRKLGKKISALVQPGDLFAFYGELGVGKTCFIQGICNGLGVKEGVNSPSFTLINEYQGKIPIYHFDLFRLSSIDEFLDLGYEEYFYGKGLTVIEWAEKIEAFLPSDYLKIEINSVGYYQRRIIFKSTQTKYQVLIKE